MRLLQFKALTANERVDIVPCCIPIERQLFVVLIYLNFQLQLLCFGKLDMNSLKALLEENREIGEACINDDCLANRPVFGSAQLVEEVAEVVQVEFLFF